VTIFRVCLLMETTRFSERTRLRGLNCLKCSYAGGNCDVSPLS